MLIILYRYFNKQNVNKTYKIDSLKEIRKIDNKWVIKFKWEGYPGCDTW